MNDMPRYIEEEAFVNFVNEHFCNGCNNYNGIKCKSCSVDDAISFVESAPTADVVPKSQYDLAVAEREANVKGFTAQIEQLNIEIQALRGAANSYKMHYEKTKNELAREIIEEVENLLRSNKIYSGFVDLKKKYSKRYFKEDGEDTNVPTKVSSSDICVVCGEHVPEGRQICSMCETGQELLNKKKG